MTVVDGPGDRSQRLTDPRYQRLMEATRRAARGGYDAVSMRELAETCRMSMTTIYQFCRSKDQLIAEAHLGAMEGWRQQLHARPSRGSTAAERLSEVMRVYSRALGADEQMTRTLMRAVYSVDPAVSETRATLGDTARSILSMAVGDDPSLDREAVVSTIGHVIDSVIFNWMLGRHDAAWVEIELEAAVRALTRPSHDS